MVPPRQPAHPGLSRSVATWAGPHRPPAWKCSRFWRPWTRTNRASQGQENSKGHKAPGPARPCCALQDGAQTPILQGSTSGELGEPRGPKAGVCEPGPSPARDPGRAPQHHTADAELHGFRSQASRMVGSAPPHTHRPGILWHYLQVTELHPLAQALVMQLEGPTPRSCKEQARLPRGPAAKWSATLQRDRSRVSTQDPLD